MNDNVSVHHATRHLLNTSEQGLVLLGSRCVTCHEYYFPATDSCTRCCGSQMAVCELGSQGTLWSWTVQAFQPKSPYNGGEAPEDFEAYGVGYIEMPSGIRIESRLTISDPTKLTIGMPMHLVEADYGKSADAVLRTFAFTPSNPTEESV
ncbi:MULTISPECIES: Zn-ribbon domain-containing OB-fold protein [Pseudomonas]|uniref:Zn-ribbon domain-containing OB-fold protein n=1 Tax=Pseudomonas TaxID=286 RepID=UPI001239E283|nr:MULTISPECIES: OB-fold domain-containing protein [Pseudomonas]QIB51209.1 DNA-binding protein [Pseudomonas sp. OIL-1]